MNQKPLQMKKRNEFSQNTESHRHEAHFKAFRPSIPKSIQTLLGHKSIKTTTIYIHLVDPVCREIKSPL